MINFQIGNDKIIKVENNDTSILKYKILLRIISPEELNSIKDIGQIPQYIKNECCSNNHHLRIDSHKEYIYGILNSIEVNKNNTESFNFNFFLTQNSLVIVDKKETNLVTKFISNILDEEFIQRYNEISPQLLLLCLLDEIIENNEHYISKIENDLEKLEEKILNSAKKEYSKEIIANRRMIIQLKHKIESFPCLIKLLHENENGLFNEQQLKAVNILEYKAIKMVDNANLLRDYASQVREAFEAETDMQINQLMKVFTVITSIFMPLTLIAGWYGMNFTTMPELTSDYGYVYVLTLSISVVIFLLIYFKKKKLLK